MPQHVDFTTALVPGVMSFTTPAGRDEYLALDVGTLVKKGNEVLVSTRNAFRGPELGHLKEVVIRQFEEIDEREKKARAAAAKLEVDLLRRFMELRHE
jgi:F-type H+-transporting ATPase subunit epsilon